MYSFIWIHVYSLLLPTVHVGIITTTATPSSSIVHWIHLLVSSSSLAYTVTFTILSTTVVCHCLQWLCWWGSHVECIAQYWQYSHWNENQLGKWGKIQIIYVCYVFTVASIRGCWLDHISTLCDLNFSILPRMHINASSAFSQSCNLAEHLLNFFSGCKKI